MWLLGSRNCNKLSKTPSRMLWYIVDAQQFIVVTMLSALCDNHRIGKESPEEEWKNHWPYFQKAHVLVGE